jgi:DHA3 family macrolide efflux protein-like MFS transporter
VVESSGTPVGDEPAVAAPRLAGLHVIRGNRAYQIFLTATLLSFTGSTVHIIAASWLILQLTGNGYAVPLLLLFSVIPGVVLTPVVGTLIDRLDSRALLILVDAISAIAVFSVPVTAWLGTLHAWQLYAVEIAVAVCGQFYGPASRVFVWRLARPEELLAANSTVTLVYQLGIAFGALGGGGLVAVAGPLAGLLLNAASFAVSGVGMALIGRTRQWHRRRPIEAPDLVRWRGMWRELGRTARLVASRPRILHMTVLYLNLQSAHRLLAGLLVPFVAAAGLGPGTQGTLQMSFSLGAVVAGGTIPWLAHRFGELPLLLLGSLGVAALMVAFSLADARWLALALYFGLGLAVSSWVYDLTAAQQLIPGERQGRYFALAGSLVSLAGVGVFTATSALLRFLQPRTLYWLAAAAVLATALPSVVRTRWLPQPAIDHGAGPPPQATRAATTGEEDEPRVPA